MGIPRWWVVMDDDEARMLMVLIDGQNPSDVVVGAYGYSETG